MASNTIPTSCKAPSSACYSATRLLPALSIQLVLLREIPQAVEELSLQILRQCGSSFRRYCGSYLLDRHLFDALGLNELDALLFQVLSPTTLVERGLHILFQLFPLAGLYQLL